MATFEEVKKTHLETCKSFLEVLADFETTRRGVKTIVGSAKLVAYDQYGEGHASAGYVQGDIGFNVRYLGERAHIVKFKNPNSDERW